jgi:hypothetical protein
MMNLDLEEVYTFKLTSGEELVGKVVSLTDSYVELSHPLSIAPNHQGMGLMPSMFTAEPERNVRLNTSAVTMYGETVDAVRLKYIEATTGIATPSKKIVLG